MPDNLALTTLTTLTTLAPAASLALLLLAGCGSEPTKHEKEFDKLVQGLPGQYDNRAQAKSDASGEHAAVALVINPVNALAIGSRPASWTWPPFSFCRSGSMVL